jgi:UDP-N-acetylglucosamine diphosphorylase/glucosamine-1-phosphate N-acetyltransferase
MDRREVAAAVVDYPWNLIERNACQIVEDCARLPGSAVVPSEYPGVYFMNERDIVLGAGVVLMPGVVLDADEGPVRIGAGTRILPHTYIQGPVSIGDHVLVQAGSHIHAGVTIGPVCKIGGEVTASIVSGYSNKQHHGFLGHAYTGQWVNLGAGTTNSNLKNTYGSVSMLIKGRRIDTGMMFMGALLGDFSRTAINTSLNTGTIVGFSSHIVFPGFPPKYIPPFHWLTEKGLVPFETTGALKVAERMMARRRITMGTAERTRFLRLAEEAAKEGKTP